MAWFKRIARYVLFASFPIAVGAAPIQAIVFDFGGVIADFNSQQIGSFLSCSLQLSHLEGLEIYHQLQAALDQGQSVQIFWRQLALSKSIQLPKHWLTLFSQATGSAVVSIPGTLSVAQALRKQGYRVGMLSNTNSFHASVIYRLGYYDFFYPVLLSYKIGVAKPHLKAYQALLKALNLPPSAVIFIDNIPENVEAAKRLGMHGILFTNCQALCAELNQFGMNTH